MQLRKKLCYFTIMVLSCCDLLAVLTNHPFTALMAMLWLSEKFNVSPSLLVISIWLSGIFIGFSLLTLFLMSVDRYVATYYPIFHQTSMTKRKLLILFAFAAIIQLIVTAMSINDLVISYEVSASISFTIFIPTMLFINYKLFN